MLVLTPPGIIGKGCLGNCTKLLSTLLRQAEGLRLWISREGKRQGSGLLGPGAGRIWEPRMLGCGGEGKI